MARFTNPTHLLQEQYKDASNLGARYDLHARFGTNPQPWHRWVFEQFDLPGGASVFEVGCGSGLLWSKNSDRLPGGLQLTLTDLSPGMLDTARTALEPGRPEVRYAAVDAQALPFEAEAFDAIIANHMLYHVPDRPRAIAELRRVLRPGGLLYAATNGANHMHELTGGLHERLNGLDGFGLENGPAQLRESFSNVELRRYEDALAITDVAPVMAYARSIARSGTNDPELERLHAKVERAIALEGAFRVTKDAGLLIATA